MSKLPEPPTREELLAEECDDLNRRLYELIDDNQELVKLLRAAKRDAGIIFDNIDMSNLLQKYETKE